MFFILCGLLCLFCLGLIVWPSMRKGKGKILTPTDMSGETETIAFRQDQLAALKADHEKGLMSKAEAAQASREIERRLLEELRDNAAREPEKQRPLSSATFFAVLLCVPVIAFGLYSILGSPGMRDWPRMADHTQRLHDLIQNSDQTAEKLITRLRKRLQTHPDDAMAWQLLAQSLLAAGEVEMAIDTLRNWIEQFTDQTAEPTDKALVIVQLAELLTQQADGRPTDEAIALFEQAAGLDPLLPQPAFYLAEVHWLKGERAQAILAWQALLDRAPADAPWRELVAARLDEAQKEIEE